MNKRKPLGKGLGALLPSDSEVEARAYFICSIDDIAPNPSQPRKNLDDESLGQLADSIREKGVLLPLVVREAGDQRFEIIAGERRWRAARLAGLEEVPVLVKDVSPLDQLELALVENIQRQDLNPLEEAEAYLRLVREFGLTQEEVARRVGKERSTVANTLRINQLPDFAKEDLVSGQLTMGHARVLLGLDDDQARREVRDKIIGQGLTVRQAEALVQQRRKPKGQATRRGRSPAPGLPESYCRTVARDLGRSLDTRVRIVQHGARGKVEIEYSSADDLERLLGLVRKNHG